MSLQTISIALVTLLGYALMRWTGVTMTMTKLLAVRLLTLTTLIIGAQAQTTTKQLTPKQRAARLTTKQRISPLVARLTYLWAGEIRDAGDSMTCSMSNKDKMSGGEIVGCYELSSQATDQIDAIRKQIDQSIQFDCHTAGDLIILHMVDNGAFRMEGLILHRAGQDLGYDPSFNPYICLDRVQDGARSYSIAMIETNKCGTAQ